MLDVISREAQSHGPVHLLLISAAELGFAWDGAKRGWVRVSLPHLRMITGPVQHFRSAILDAWRFIVFAKLSERKGFLGGEYADFTGSLQLLTSSHLRERDKMLLRAILCGRVWNEFLLGKAKKEDMDDLTLGEMLTAAHRRQVDYCVPGGMSVSQSSSVVFDGSGQPDGERIVDRSGQLDVTRNVIEAHSTFSEDTRIEHTHDRSWKPDERDSSNAQIRTLLEEQRQTILANIAKKSVVTNSMQLTQKKSADFSEKNYGDRNWNFVKLVNKVLQKWKNFGNSRVLP